MVNLALDSDALGPSNMKKRKYNKPSYRKITEKIFTNAAGDRALRLDGGYFPSDIQKIVSNALVAHGYCKKIKADRIAFHLIDWNADAAFITALILYPEKFKRKEISEGIAAFAGTGGQSV